jgi:hypothetical protein
LAFAVIAIMLLVSLCLRLQSAASSHGDLINITLWLFNVAMENAPFIDAF